MKRQIGHNLYPSGIYSPGLPALTLKMRDGINAEGLPHRVPYCARYYIFCNLLNPNYYSVIINIIIPLWRRSSLSLDRWYDSLRIIQVVSG